jgi:hypothetical protein
MLKTTVRLVPSGRTACVLKDCRTMQKSVLVGLFSSAIALALSACGGSSNNTETPAAAGSVAATTAGSMAAAAAKECAKITMDPTFSQNNCNNAADKCFLLDHAADVRMMGGVCATKNCVQFVAKPNDPAAKKCFTDCLDKALKDKFNASVSAPCLICPDAVVVCTTTDEGSGKACLNQCISAPDSAECTACMCAQHPNALGMDKPGSCLIDAYADCTGFRPTAEQVSCPAGSK